MVAIASLVIGLFLARYVSGLRTVGLVQAVLFAVACVVLVTTAPHHGSTHSGGLLLCAALIPLTVLALALGRIWRNRSVDSIDAA